MRWIQNGLLLLAAVCMGGFFAEVGLRFLEGATFFPVSFLDREIERQNGKFQYEPNVGWVQHPHFQRRSAPGVFGYSTGKDGLRLPLAADPSRADAIVVGDSFAFGVDVEDAQTIPAVLQTTGHSVWNAGVSGYGVDQTYLRALQLLSRYRAKTLLFLVVADDIERAQYARRWGKEKPYFELDCEKLEVKNVPVPPSAAQPRRGWFRSTLSYSYLAHRVIGRFFPSFWFHGVTPENDYRKVNENGPEIFCAILEKLGEFKKRFGMDVVVVGFPQAAEDALPMLAKYAACVKSPSVRLLDLTDAFQRVKRNDDARFQGFFQKPPLLHYTPSGYAFVAQEIDRALYQRN